MENKSILKDGANADARAGHFHVAGNCNDERFVGGRRERDVVAGIGGKIYTGDTHAVILAFYLTSDPMRRVVREVADRSRHCNCLFLLPLGGSSRRNKDEEYRSTLGLHMVVSQPCHGSVQY